MKKLSILVVLILALISNSYAQETDAEKMMLYEVTWDASGFSSGVYFLRMSYDNNAETQMITLIK